MIISFSDFQKLDMRVGKIISINDFPESKNLSYKIEIDFGKEIGIKKSSAQATNYTKEQLLGMQVICVINFQPKQIASFMSEVLILGVPTENKGTALLVPEKEAKLGSKVF